MSAAEAAVAASPRTAARSQRRRVPASWLQLAIVFAVLAPLPLVKVVDPDFWWHLRTGQLIFHDGIPRSDPFSWTAGGRAWAAHEWLSELIIYAVESTLGYAGNVALFSGATIAAICVMYALARQAGAGTRPLLLLTFLSAVMFARFITVRPQAFTWLLFAVFVLVIERWRTGAAAPVWLLPPLMLLWVNLHLGFVYGLVVVAAWLASSAWERVRGRAADLRTPALVAGTSLLAVSLNPSGPAILLYPLRYFEDRQSLSMIMEWQRPDFLNPLMAPYLLAIVLIVVALLAPKRPGAFLSLVSLAAVALSLSAVRNLPFAALLLLPVAGGVAARTWAAAGVSRDATTRVPLPFAIAVAGGLVVFMVVAGVRVRGSITSPSDDGYPAGGVAYLRQYGLAGRRLFNEYSWGGYLIDRLYPDGRVFIDGRTDFYRSRLLTEYMTVAKVEPGWDRTLADERVDVLLLGKDSRLARQLRGDPRWREVYTGEVESVFVPSEAPAP